MTVSTVPAYVMPFATTFLTGSPSTPLMRARPSFRGRVSGVGRCRFWLPLSCRARADAESTNQDSSDDVPLLVTEEMQLEKKVAQLRSTERRIDAQELKEQRVDDKLDAVKVELRDKTITADERASLLNEKSFLSRRSRMILNVLEMLYKDVAKLKQEIEELQKVGSLSYSFSSSVSCVLYLLICPPLHTLFSRPPY